MTVHGGDVGLRRGCEDQGGGAGWALDQRRAARHSDALRREDWWIQVACMCQWALGNSSAHMALHYWPFQWGMQARRHTAATASVIAGDVSDGAAAVHPGMEWKHVMCDK